MVLEYNSFHSSCGFAAKAEKIFSKAHDDFESGSVLHKWKLTGSKLYYLSAKKEIYTVKGIEVKDLWSSYISCCQDSFLSFFCKMNDSVSLWKLLKEAYLK